MTFRTKLTDEEHLEFVVKYYDMYAPWIGKSKTCEVIGYMTLKSTDIDGIVLCGKPICLFWGPGDGDRFFISIGGNFCAGYEISLLDRFKDPKCLIWCEDGRIKTNKDE